MALECLDARFPSSTAKAYNKKFWDSANNEPPSIPKGTGATILEPDFGNHVNYFTTRDSVSNKQRGTLTDDSILGGNQYVVKYNTDNAIMGKIAFHGQRQFNYPSSQLKDLIPDITFTHHVKRRTQPYLGIDNEKGLWTETLSNEETYQQQLALQELGVDQGLGDRPVNPYVELATGQPYIDINPIPKRLEAFNDSDFPDYRQYPELETYVRTFKQASQNIEEVQRLVAAEEARELPNENRLRDLNSRIAQYRTEIDKALSATSLLNQTAGKNFKLEDIWRRQENLQGGNIRTLDQTYLQPPGSVPPAYVPVPEGTKGYNNGLRSGPPDGGDDFSGGGGGRSEEEAQRENNRNKDATEETNPVNLNRLGKQLSDLFENAWHHLYQSTRRNDPTQLAPPSHPLDHDFDGSAFHMNKATKITEVDSPSYAGRVNYSTYPDGTEVDPSQVDSGRTPTKTLRSDMDRSLYTNTQPTGAYEGQNTQNLRNPTQASLDPLNRPYAMTASEETKHIWRQQKAEREAEDKERTKKWWNEHKDDWRQSGTFVPAQGGVIPQNDRRLQIPTTQTGAPPIGAVVPVTTADLVDDRYVTAPFGPNNQTSLVPHAGAKKMPTAQQDPRLISDQKDSVIRVHPRDAKPINKPGTSFTSPKKTPPPKPATRSQRKKSSK